MLNFEIRRWPDADAFYDERGGRYSGEALHGLYNWDDIGLFGHPQGMEPEPIAGEMVEILGETAYVITSDSQDRIEVNVVAETGDVYALRNRTKEVTYLGNLEVADPKRGTGYPRGITYMRADEVIGDYSRTGMRGRPLSYFIKRIAGLRNRHPLWLVNLEKGKKPVLRDTRFLAVEENGERLWVSFLFQRAHCRSETLAFGAWEKFLLYEEGFMPPVIGNG